MVTKNFKIALVALLGFLFLNASPAEAQTRSSKYAALVVNADNGTILHQRNANALRYPASLTKMMTLYLAFEALEKGELQMNTVMRASRNAASQPPMGLNLYSGEQITVRDAIHALIIKSANDAAVVLAEEVGGSEWQFARQMTAKAKELGMNNTTFKNASGLPDSRQVSTAVDLAKLAIALKRDYPQYFPMFSQQKFSRRGINYVTHNRVAKNYRGATGMKTGYINASGFNLVTTATRGNANLVGVVLGGVTSKKRDAQMVSLLDNAFSRLGVTQQYANKKPAVQQVAASVASNSPTPVARPLGTKIQTKIQNVSYTPSVQEKRAWAIQVGRYKQRKDAVRAVARARDLAGDQLEASRATFSKNSNRRVHSAKLANLTEGQAKSACSAIRSARQSCTVVRLN